MPPPSLLTSDLSVYKQLSPTDLLPVLAIALLSFLLKAGTQSPIFLGLKKLWKWITKKR